MFETPNIIFNQNNV